MRRVDDTLTPFSYYGGKYKMSKMICEMLPYNGVELYVEPFGGACRVLLNKLPHPVEIYNDTSLGLYTLFEALKDSETAEQVINQLLELEPDQKVFEEMLQYKMQQEKELIEYYIISLKKIVWKKFKQYDKHPLLKKLHEAITQREYLQIIEIASEIAKKNIIKDSEDEEQYQYYLDRLKEYWNIVKTNYQEAYDSVEKGIKKRDVTIEPLKLHKWCHRFALQEIESYTADILCSNESERDPVKMAVATFITYHFSRDGMGRDFSNAKGENLKKYYNSVERLAEVGKRLEHVELFQQDAFFLIATYCENENVLFYLDPPYLSVEKSNDLGKVYDTSFGADVHEELLQLICDAKAKILISNYDVAVYNQYLTEEKGWRKIYYDTYTSVGGMSGNKRTEVIWCNF